MRAGKALFHSFGNGVPSVTGEQIPGDFLLHLAGRTGVPDMLPFSLITMDVDRMPKAAAITLPL